MFSFFLKELDKKVKVMSKRRSELLLAREMDKAQHQKAEVLLFLLQQTKRIKLLSFEGCL